MSLFTKIGTGLWNWDPFRRLERNYDDVVGRCTKLFWLGLYTTPEAKMVVPGMFLGSITTMADACRIPADDARTYLHRLVEDDMVEYDIERRVLRMVALPDYGESPTNGKAILGWWRRFQTVPECNVRNAHVSTLRWIIDEWCRHSGKALSHDHANAWSQTFGQISVPLAKRRSPKHVQTDLFTASDPFLSGSPKSNNLDRNTCSTRVEQDPDPDLDPGSQSPEERGSGGERPPPPLRLVSNSVMYAEALAELLFHATAGKFPRAVSVAQWQALQSAVDATGSKLGDETVRVALGDYVKRGMPGFDPPRDTMTTEERAARSRGISPEMVAAPGWLGVAIQKATDWAAAVADKIALAAESRKELGFE